VEPGVASTTARRVAAHRISFTRRAAAFGRAEDDDRLQADVAAGVEVAPSNMSLHLQARTTFFDDIVVATIEHGVTDIVAVGAGYDGRSLRYARPDLHWFELDHPDTQADKRARLQRLDITTDTTFVAADFELDDIAAALTDAGHDPTAPTLFVCEGVAAYLQRDSLQRLLSALAAHAGAGSTLAITVPTTPIDDGQAVRRAALADAVAAVGEPLRTSLDRAEVIPFFASAGWRIDTDRQPAAGGAIIATPL